MLITISGNTNKNKTIMAFSKTLEKPHYDNERLFKEVYEDIINGIRNDVILSKIQKGEYSKKFSNKTTAEDVIKAVRKMMRKDWEDRKEVLKGEYLTRMENLYRKCMEANDRSTAATVLRDFAKVTGLTDPQKVELDISADIQIDFGVDEVEVQNTTD